MFYNAKNGTLNIGDTTMDYIRFGSSQRVLIMLPGLGDALQSVKGTALPIFFVSGILQGLYGLCVQSQK